jgi:hypothetical protein
MPDNADELQELKALVQTAVDTLGDQDVYDDIRKYPEVDRHDDAMLALRDWLAKRTRQSVRQS